MGRKSREKREKRDRVKPEKIVKPSFNWEETIGVLLVIVIFFGGVVFLDSWGKNSIRIIEELNQMERERKIKDVYQF
jgi:hypothetical protein